MASQSNGRNEVLPNGAISGARTVHISTEAFWSLSIATIEVFKKECFGYLVGYKLEDRWIVVRAFPHQTARRSYAWVKPMGGPRKRIEKAQASLSNGETIIGWFHSHPEWGDIRYPSTLSAADVKTARPNELLLVIAIRTAHQPSRWRMNSYGSILGGLGDYHLKVSGYVKNSGGQIEQLKVACPYAVGFHHQASPTPSRLPDPLTAYL